jgi:hypothetical protein
MDHIGLGSARHTGTKNRNGWEVFVTNAGNHVNRKATQTDKASLRCDSKEDKLSYFRCAQGWHHDYSTRKCCHASSTSQEQVQQEWCLQELVPSAATSAALTTLPATASSYAQPLMPSMGGLFQSTNGEFEAWIGGRPLYDWTGLNSTWVMKSITKSASSYKLQWSSEKLQLSSKGIEDYI